jgi:hypothetical protein
MKKAEHTVKISAEEQSAFDAIERRFVEEGRDERELTAIRELREWYERGPEEAEPPRAAEFLLEILSTSERWQYLVGDLRDQFDRDTAKIGRARAARRYWAHVIRSLLPLVLRGVRKKASEFVDGSLVTHTSSSVNTYFHDIATNKANRERK